jgi:hypothetical protein
MCCEESQARREEASAYQDVLRDKPSAPRGNKRLSIGNAGTEAKRAEKSCAYQNAGERDDESLGYRRQYRRK